MCFEVRVERLEGDQFFLGVDGVIPGAFRERFLLEHGSVVRGIGRAKTGTKGTNTLLAIDLKVEDVDDESVAGLGAVDKERAGERIIDFDVGEGIARLLQSVAKAVERVGFEDRTGFEVSDRIGGTEGGFDVVHRGAEVDHFGRLRSEKSCRESGGDKEKDA